MSSNEPEIKRATIQPSRLGSATVTPTGRFEAGSWCEFTLSYTAGFYGVDDSGGVRLAFRYPSDQTPPQLEDPIGPGFTTVEASNGATLACRYDPKGNLRPWDKTLQIKVVKGFLREGDTITIRIGDRRRGSRGIRLQTFCEDTFEFRVLVDAIATCNFLPLPEQPTIAIGPGPGRTWRIIVPSVARPGEQFGAHFKVEDKWGNPTDLGDRRAFLSFEGPGAIKQLPHEANIRDGETTTRVDGLFADVAGDYRLLISDAQGQILASSNPIRIEGAPDLRLFWGDIHGQSEETIGTNSAECYFAFARDKAFLDVTGHQGNDFQITADFWRKLNELTCSFNEAGRFVVLPGYEWSGNTSLGGDRNVYFATEGRTIRRSSHALVPDASGTSTDCPTAESLFEAFRQAGEDVICVAHCGGRYADISAAHDGMIERAVEVHSSWGTFEWIVHDALRLGYRVGIVGNSDGHKGRPGASYPGASLFGAVGGLTGYWCKTLDRPNILKCLRDRHHFATTGNRMLLKVGAEFDTEVDVYHDDPSICPAEPERATAAMMGDIVNAGNAALRLTVDVSASSPIVSIDILNGLDLVETRRSYSSEDNNRRLRVIWQGAEYRGRARETYWDGSATVRGGRIVDARPFNFFNPQKKFEWSQDGLIKWEALTTGNFGGFDLWLDDARAGELSIVTPLLSTDMQLADIGSEEIRFDLGGLDRALRIFRLPEKLEMLATRFELPVILAQSRDNAFYVRVTLEDGNVAWSSPIYVYR